MFFFGDVHAETPAQVDVRVEAPVVDFEVLVDFVERDFTKKKRNITSAATASFHTPAWSSPV